MTMSGRAKTGLDTRPNFWYNIPMSNDTDTISVSVSHFNLFPNHVNKGFTMTFANRVTVSVRWGEGNYSDGKTTAECAAWNADTYTWVHVEGFNYDHDDVLPRLTTDQVAKFIFVASTMNPNL